LDKSSRAKSITRWRDRITLLSLSAMQCGRSDLLKLESSLSRGQARRDYYQGSRTFFRYHAGLPTAFPIEHGWRLARQWESSAKPVIGDCILSISLIIPYNER
jgi:hypothetical protein